ncbi:MAG: exo-alpha-sialidase, partial [Actinobacteria bacterium]|nr:exo-alpha-sialidase [Actinomycetota bacterium]
AAHPHDRDTFYVIPLDGGHGRLMPDGKATVWRTRDAGSTWQPLRNGLPQEDAWLGVLRLGMSIDRQDSPGLYFGTSTGQVYASADEGDSWNEVSSTLPAISSVEVGVAG